MSFPPRPPIGMPPMGYTYAPVGMMPMGLGMMPQPVMRPIVTTQSAVAQPAKAFNRKLVPQEIPKDEKEEKPPVTTVFVGNISDRAPDAMIRQMLQRCGNVLSWKRVQGASGKLQAFGFCEYEDPEATLRCMRLLNEWEIADKKLVVKVDAKTKTLLDEYISKKKSRTSEAEGDDKEKKENGEKESDSKVEEDLDEFTKREDRVAKAGLDAIMREYAGDLTKKVFPDVEKEAKPVKKKVEEEKIIKDTGIDDIDIEDDKREIIHREIKSFRDLHKGEDEAEKDAEKDKEREERIRLAEERRRRERERMKERERERERELEKERYERERERERIRSRTRSRSRSPKRWRERSRSREKERRKERDRDAEDEEEAYERRKLEKKLREKEAAYQERLKNWEARERKKAREYEKEREREEERKAEEAREARRLKEFLEDYDDERDDVKYYKGSCLNRRLKEREKEREADARDRQREKEELEEIKRKLLDEGHPDPEAELMKIELEREEHLKPRLNISEEKSPVSQKEPIPVDSSDEADEEEEEKPQLPPNMKSTLKPIDVSNSVTPMSEDNDSNFPPPDEDSQPVYGPTKEENAKLGFGGLKLGSSSSPTESISNKRKKLTVGDVFNQDDEDSSSGAKKRKLVPLDYDDDKEGKKGGATAEEKRVKIKQLIESIPTAKDELFAYPLDWNIVDQVLMDKRIKPWVNKKIIEYIGEEEPTLTEFICQKVMARSGPQAILNDVAMVLDEEAEVFVVKMWRLLVYETEAKKLGLVK
ncbi:RNA-binding protein 25-like [Saccostrea echinata]|uniref:RNA-binding protein 25-like n=1 Tax=Saccostrea echinata TaxID=191078 RepID=UPI002A8361E4|nr:RNA-binding protein 25-like [Saccostrea echinata]